MTIKKQEELKDCGLFIIQALVKQMHNKNIGINKLREDAAITEKGLNGTSLVNLGQNWGLDLVGYRSNLEEIIKNNQGWMVALIENNAANHYVLFKIITKNQIKVADPSTGKVSLYRKSSFEKIFKEIFFTVKEIPIKKEIKNNKKVISIIFKNKRFFIYALISAFLSVILTFASTFYSRIIIDSVIPSGQNKLLLAISLSFALIIITKIIFHFFKSYLTKKIYNRIEIDFSLLYLNKLASADTKQLNKISQADHLRRMSLVNPVSEFITSFILLLFNEIFVLAVASGVLIWLSIKLFAIVITFGVLTIIITFLIQYFLLKKYEDLLIASKSSYQSQFDATALIGETKHKYFKKYIDRLNYKNLKNLKKIDQTIWGLSSVQKYFEMFISLCVPIFITFFAVKLIFSNNLTVGTMVMFISAFHYFIDPLINICDFALKFQHHKKNLNLLSFALDLKDEKLNENGYRCKKINSLVITNLDFRYDKKILDIKNLDINNSIHLTGRNGVGKTTFLKCLSLQNNFCGKYEINKIGHDFYNLEDLRSKFLYLGSSSYLIPGSVLENITLGNNLFKIHFLKWASKVSLNEFFKILGINLDTQIINNGNNLSAGQRQIIILLRAFALKPEVVLLDEALENIDKEKINIIKKWLTKDQRIFIEVSRSNKYLKEGKEVNLEKININ